MWKNPQISIYESDDLNRKMIAEMIWISRERGFVVQKL